MQTDFLLFFVNFPFRRLMIGSTYSNLRFKLFIVFFMNDFNYISGDIRQMDQRIVHFIQSTSNVHSQILFSKFN